VWRRDGPWSVQGIDSVMVSFKDIVARPTIYRECLRVGLREYFQVSGDVYLDNGSFSRPSAGESPDFGDYETFVRWARPQWYPVPFDFMGLPSDSRRRRLARMELTQKLNRKYGSKGFVPVVHAGPLLRRQIRELDDALAPKRVAIGGLVPYLRHMHGAGRYDVVRALCELRIKFVGNMHVFGIGGPVSLLMAEAIGADSVDSSGWQMRAVNGAVLLPLGAGQLTTRARYRERLSASAKRALKHCDCEPCRRRGARGLFRRGRDGFKHRAVHNLEMLVREAQLIRKHLASGDLREWALERFASSPYFRLVEEIVSVALDHRPASCRTVDAPKL